MSLKYQVVRQYNTLKYCRHGIKHRIGGSAHISANIVAIELDVASAEYLYGRLIL